MNEITKHVIAAFTCIVLGMSVIPAYIIGSNNDTIKQLERTNNNLTQEKTDFVEKYSFNEDYSFPEIKEGKVILELSVGKAKSVITNVVVNNVVAWEELVSKSCVKVDITKHLTKSNNHISIRIRDKGYCTVVLKYNDNPYFRKVITDKIGFDLKKEGIRNKKIEISKPFFAHPINKKSAPGTFRYFMRQCHSK